MKCVFITVKCVFITAMVIYTITIQAVPCFYDNISSYHPVLHVIEASAHSREHTASGSTFSISPAAMLDLLASEFNDHDPEDGRYAATQRRQEAENSPATTGEFNRTLNAAVNEVQQPHTVEETSSAYARRRAAQE
jgi:hypothetical protein